MLSHFLVAVLFAAMVAAGLWQLDRHGQRGERNDLIEARAELDRVPLAAIAPPGADDSVGETEQYRRVEVVGEYRSDDEVLIRNRTLGGAPGWWVLTPLVTDDGWAVAVNRGWISLAYDADSARPGTEAPAGRVSVSGWIQPSRQAEGLQRADPSEGRLTTLARPDIERLAAQVDYPLSPVVLRIDPAEIAAGTQPTPLPLPSLDAGPHISYAVQWFIFATIAGVGYPLVLRRLVGEGRQGRELPKEADQLQGRR